MSDTEMTQYTVMEHGRKRTYWKVRCTECNRIGHWMVSGLSRDKASRWMVDHSVNYHEGT